MIRVIQRRLIIPRGDTGTFTVPALSPGQAGSVGVFTIFDPITKTRIFQKQVELEGNVFNIVFGHGDTVNLQAGDYLWDIKFYKNPIFADNKVIDGEEIDSYYAAFQTPKCEIRETGDAFMSIEGAHADIEDINLILAATQAANAAKDAATEQAGIAADKAEQAAARLAEMIAAIPTKVSDLIDDSGHYTKPATGIPASDLEETYLTEHQDLSNYVQFTDYASANTAGVVKVNNASGLSITQDGEIKILPAAPSTIMAGDDFQRPITVNRLNLSTFFGLARAAGLTDQIMEGNSLNYTSIAKTAIQAMLGVPSISDIPTNVSELANDAGYLTQHQDISGKANSADLAAVATSGSYEDLSDKPTIPDVQIDGTSIVENGVANIHIANNETFGVVKGATSNGVYINSDGFLSISSASNSLAKIGSDTKRPITPYNQHAAAFYGLAKAAGDTTQPQSSNAVGTYTDSAKTAIQQMLGVPSTAAIPTLVSQLTNDSGYLTSFTETDPTVPSWAKAAQKPTYTAAEVGAPTVQEMNTAIGNAIGNINSFDMAVVQELPTQDISTHTIYLVPKTGETNDVYDEYVYINNAWEMVGNTQVDLSNYALKSEIPEVPVQDVQADGVSILNNNVANIPLADANNAGLVRISASGGLAWASGGAYVRTAKATSAQIKEGTNEYRPIVPSNQNLSVFYGLATAAGDTTQSQSNNAVGTYTTEAKAAIRSMIGAAASADVTVQDVQVNGSSILSNGIANVPIASNSSFGVVTVGNGLTMINDMFLAINAATSAQLKTGTQTYRPIVPSIQHESTFYGLAKAAGDTTQSQSNNAVGTYTTEAKAAIQTMLDTPSNADLALKADKTDTVLETTLSRGRKDNTTVGGASLAFGIDTEASGYYSIALGLNTTASSQGAFAEGKNTVARYIAHAEGEDTQALGQWAHSQGVGTIAKGAASFAGGDNTIANGHSSFVTGRYNAADSYDNWAFWAANTSYAVGDKVKREQLVNNEPTIIGYICKEANTDETFDISHWDFDSNHMNYSVIVGNGYEAEDPETHQVVRHGSNAYALDWDGTAHYAGDVYVNANADSSGGVKVATVNDVSIYATKVDTVLETTLSRGRKENTTIGMASIAFGVNVEASGMYSIATGMLTTASNNYAKAEGYRTTASANAAHAEGNRTIASGINAHAEGTNTTASAEAAHSEGTKTTAGGTGSHSEGYGTLANACLLHAEGRYNQGATVYFDWAANTEYTIGDKVSYYGIGYICTDDNTDAEWNNEHWQIIYHNSDKALVIGNGTADNARSNAYALDWSGNGHYAGDIYVGANADSTGGTKVATVAELATKLDAADAGLKVVRLI